MLVDQLGSTRHHRGEGLRHVKHYVLALKAFAAEIELITKILRGRITEFTSRDVRGIDSREIGTSIHTQPMFNAAECGPILNSSAADVLEFLAWNDVEQLMKLKLRLSDVLHA